MDIAGLRSELDRQLKRNPHEDAGGGFRDRFEQAVEHHAAETDPEDKSELEAMLGRIVSEAEAAANAACAEEVVEGTMPITDGDGRSSPSAGRPSRRRVGIVVAAVAAAAAAAVYFYSGSS